MSAQREDIPNEKQQALLELAEAVRSIQDDLRAAHPDYTEEDWERFADEWAEEVNEGLRNIVRRSRGELAAQST